MKAIVFVLAVVLLQANSQVCLGEGEVPNWMNSICIRPQYIEGCFSYASRMKCHQCEFLYEKTQDGKCVLKSQDNIRQCCQKKLGGQCFECKAGLMLGGGKCRELNIDGCLRKDYLNGKCHTCASQFILLGGYCQIAVRNCVQYSNVQKTQCKTCANDYSLISNTCVKNTILGCSGQSNGLCNSCYFPFELVESGKCIIQNCKVYNDFGCVACQCGFYITQGGICKAIGEGCIRYMRGKCINCLPSWKLMGNVCVLPGCEQLQTTVKGGCRRCKAGYELNDSGRCQLLNCLNEGHDFCYECKSGFVQRLGKCQPSENNLSTVGQ